ncbi:MAG: aminopeptidase P N-terminal domain-containing protein [Oligoflexia bacterium]|nr:aminopeptidase P N-terminal domain-containing protein [Oligoflexia bacterium]
MLKKEVPGFFKARREALLRAHPGAAFILPAAPEVIRNPDVHYPYRQESGFYYLSGFEEPQSWLVVAPNKNSPGTSRMILFVRHNDPEKEIWEGARYGTEGAARVFGADATYLFDDFSNKLPELLQDCERIFYRFGHSAENDRVVFGALEPFRRGLDRAGKIMPALQDPSEALGEMRLFKSAEEAALLRRACEISALAHKTAMKEVRPGMNEYEIEALIDYSFRRQGCGRVGYSSIVAGGKNATCLHYHSNNERLRDGDLLLIDAGGEYDYYTADISRTFPIGRGFSDAQATVYDLVLRAQKEALAVAKPGALLPDIHHRATEVLVDGLLSLGLLKGKTEEIIRTGEHRRFYPHGTSHWLGMDVHDVGLYRKNSEPRPLEPGMCFTIEPGLYFQSNDRDVPEKFRNIGVRIEDDILITANGCENLTIGAPKERAEIEALRS